MDYSVIVSKVVFVPELAGSQRCHRRNHVILKHHAEPYSHYRYMALAEVAVHGSFTEHLRGKVLIARSRCLRHLAIRRSHAYVIDLQIFVGRRIPKHQLPEFLNSGLALYTNCRCRFTNARTVILKAD